MGLRVDESKSFRSQQGKSKSKHSTRKSKIKQFLIGRVLTTNGLLPFLFPFVSRGLNPTFTASP